MPLKFNACLFLILDVLSHNISLVAEEGNHIKVAKILLDIVPKYLRQLFIEKWNQKYPNHKWKSDRASGEYLFRELPLEVKSRKARGKVIDKLRSGNENEWDMFTLIFVMLDSSLDLVEGCRRNDRRIPPLRISEEIDLIRVIKNDFYSHASSMSCSFSNFMTITSRIKSTAKHIFGNDAGNEIANIVQSPVATTMTIERLKQQLEKEKNSSYELERLLKGKLQYLIFKVLCHSIRISGKFCQILTFPSLFVTKCSRTS